jgi:uncharacterized protein
MKVMSALARASLAAGVFLVASNAWSASPSFDCAKASGEVENLICNDAELAKLDRSLSQLYSTVLKNTPASRQKTLKTVQRGWVKGRNDCWKSDDVRGCVANEYHTRINELKDL